MFERILPAQVDNRFRGHRAALWLLGLYLALKLVMSLNSIFNTAEVAAGADGIPLESFGPVATREVLTLFALTALGQLALTLIALTVLVRYRALVPFIYVMLIGEALARRATVLSFAPTRAGDGVTAFYINLALLALLAIGLALSLVHRRRGEHS